MRSLKAVAFERGRSLDRVGGRPAGWREQRRLKRLAKI